MRCFRSGGERCEECVDKVRCEIYGAVSDLKLQIEMLKIDIGNLKKEPEKPKEPIVIAKEPIVLVNNRQNTEPIGWSKPDVQEADTA